MSIELDIYGKHIESKQARSQSINVLEPNDIANLATQSSVNDISNNLNTNFLKISSVTQNITQYLSTNNVLISSAFISNGLTIFGNVSGNNPSVSFNSGFAAGLYSFAVGFSTQAIGLADYAEGYQTIANNGGGMFVGGSHAEGYRTQALGRGSHAEGSNTIALSGESHAEGNTTTASGLASHAEGSGTVASGYLSHAEGQNTIASGSGSHAEGFGSMSFGGPSHAEGQNTKASGDASHSEGLISSALGLASHAEGFDTTASGEYSHAEGRKTRTGKLIPYNSYDALTKVFTFLPQNTSFFSNYTTNSFIRGMTTFGISFEIQVANISTINGNITAVSDPFFGQNTLGLLINDSGSFGHAEGEFTEASGLASHAEGVGSIASGIYSHAEGSNTTASGSYSHAEGSNTTASALASHAEGTETLASSLGSHAEGGRTLAIGINSHAECNRTIASGNNSHAEGSFTSTGEAVPYISYINSTKVFNFNPSVSSKFNYVTQGTVIGGKDLDFSGDTFAIVVQDRSTLNGSITALKFILGNLVLDSFSGYLYTNSGQYSHAEGNTTTASGYASHAESDGTTASGYASHAEGKNTTASGFASHAANELCKALGYTSNAIGMDTKATGNYSQSCGFRSNALQNFTYIWSDGNLGVIGQTAGLYHSTTRSGQYMVSASGGVFIPGNVGIGTDNNLNPLTVVGNVSSTGVVYASSINVVDGIILKSVSGSTVWKLTIDDLGSLSAVQI